jgi:hypothetical protein
VPGYGGMVNIQKLGNLLLSEFAGLPQLPQAIFGSFVHHENFPPLSVFQVYFIIKNTCLSSI